MDTDKLIPGISTMRQSTSNLFMIRPAAFGFNTVTKSSNSFQSKDSKFSIEEIQSKALAEFDVFVHVLRLNHVDITVIDDTITPPKPDAIFPNNWISVSNNGVITLFPMAAKNRRLERRADILEKLAQHFEVTDIIDLSHHENEGTYLEGTGSIVFDHLNKVAYACISERTHPSLFEKYCKSIGYNPLPFRAVDKSKKAIYHTNVMMCIGSALAIICTESILEKTERNRVVGRLKLTGHEFVDINFKQMEQFAGNMLEVTNTKNEKLLVMSTQALNSLERDQIKMIEKHAGIVHSPIYTIEKTGGGSARCMMAEVFLPKKLPNPEIAKS